MARGDRLFAKVEVSFILRDARFRSLPEECRGCYLALWALAVETRQETLSVYASRTSYVAQVSGYGHKTVQKLLRKCKRMSDPLVTKDPNSQRITVWGVTKHHPRLFPKTSPIGDNMGTNWVVEGEGEGDRDGEGEREEYTPPVVPPTTTEGRIIEKHLCPHNRIPNPDALAEKVHSILVGGGIVWDWEDKVSRVAEREYSAPDQALRNWARGDVKRAAENAEKRRSIFGDL